MLLLFFMTSGFKTDNPAYTLFGIKGKQVKYEKMIEKLKDADIVLFGEEHNNPVAHWLELEVANDLFKVKKDSLVLGAEMFETDNQLLLNEYLGHIISKSSFESEARLWPNYHTDYQPLVGFANTNGLDFIATNIPRRYAALVNSKGFEGLDELSDEAKKLIPPLPIEYDPELSCYKNMMSMQGIESHITPNFPKAQAIKDATMAYNILKNWSPGKLFLHFNGAYHSDNFESICWYLKKQNPDLKIATITTVSQHDVSRLLQENTGKANFTICVVDNMTNTQ